MPKFKEGDRIMLEAVIVATADDGYTVRIIESGQDSQTHHLLRVGWGSKKTPSSNRNRDSWLVVPCTKT